MLLSVLFRRLLLFVLLLALAGSLRADTSFGGVPCVDFDRLTPGTIYTVGNIFLAEGITVTAQPFQWAGGVWTSGGFSRVETFQLAGGSKWDLQVNNINLDFTIPMPINGMNFRYGEYGGNLNLEVNGAFLNFNDFIDLHGTSLGGATITVIADPSGLGWVRLDGVITQFTVGGQELWIDDLCPFGPECVDFESLPAMGSWTVPQSFSDSGAVLSLDTFFWWPSGSTSTGVCSVDNSQISGGTGQDVNSNNVNLDFDFGTAYAALRLNYADLGGNENLEVDGDFRNLPNLEDLHGTTVGGAKLSVLEGLDGRGLLEVRGLTSAFKIGGQELWIDDVCIFPVIFVDGFESGDTTAWSMTVP